MDNELGLAYMKEHFEPATRPANRNGKRPAHLLLVDGHDSHVSWQVVEFALQLESTSYVSQPMPRTCCSNPPACC